MSPSSTAHLARRLLGGWLIALAAVVCACEDPNTIFHGKWVSQLAPYEAALEGELDGAPIVAMGHYGQEVAGIVYFHVDQRGPLLEESCACAYIEHQTLDLDARKVVFSTECAEGAAPDPRVLIWTLALEGSGFDEDRALHGTVRLGDGAPGQVDVSLLRQSAFVLEEDKQCPPGDR